MDSSLANVFLDSPLRRRERSRRRRDPSRHPGRRGHRNAAPRAPACVNKTGFHVEEGDPEADRCLGVNARGHGRSASGSPPHMKAVLLTHAGARGGGVTVPPRPGVTRWIRRRLDLSLRRRGESRNTFARLESITGQREEKQNKKITPITLLPTLVPREPLTYCSYLPRLCLRGEHVRLTAQTSFAAAMCEKTTVQRHYRLGARLAEGAGVLAASIPAWWRRPPGP
ncbi:unnamed protein product [Boreogadus saida]